MNSSRWAPSASTAVAAQSTTPIMINSEEGRTMTGQHSTIAVPSTTQACDRTTRITRTLLAYGVVAGPMYVITSLIQAATRQGFDLTRHEWSLLANGHLGWIQVANLMLTGMMTLAASIGFRRRLHRRPGGRLGPLLLGLYGAGFVAAGLFRADPTDGFPVGTPAGPDTEISWHGVLHLICAGIGFLCFVVAGFAVARWFSSVGGLGWARYSRLTAVVFLAAFLGLAVGAGNPVLNLCFVAAIIAAAVWLTAVSLHLYRSIEGNAQG